MDYERSNSSGTDDDLPPSQPGRRASRGGRFSGDGRAMCGSGSYGRSSASDQHVRKLEEDAYVGVLRAFMAQSGAITWRKEQLMVTLRQELGISDELHLEILMGINSNSEPSQFRERDEQVGPMYVSNIESLPGATMPGSRKKPKSAHLSQASLAPPMLKSALPRSTFSLTSAGKRAESAGRSKNKNCRGGRQQQTGLTVGSRLPSLGGSSAGEGSTSGLNPWIGKRVKVRWPADNAFYDATITDYKPDEGLHALVYEINTENETQEWVDLKKLLPTDLQIVDGPPLCVSNEGPRLTPANLTIGSRGTAGRGTRARGGRTGLLSPVGRGRSASKGPANACERSAPGLPSRSFKAWTPGNVLDIKGMKQLKLPSLDDLVKQVDKIAEEDDLAKVQGVRRAAKEHEEMLRKALAEIGESSEEDEEENPPFLREHSVERERERSREDSRDQHEDDDKDDTAEDREGSEGDPLAGNGAASDADDDHRDCGDGGEDR